MHPDHKNQIARLNRAEGQIRGITKMLEEQRYCMDILSQVKAVRSALHKIELGILEEHIRSCVTDAVVSQNQKEIDAKVDELMNFIEKRPELP